MRDETIAKQLKRSNTNLMIGGIIAVVISCLFLVLTARSNLNEVLGPVTMTAADVIKIQDPSKLFRYYISTKGSRVSGTIWQEGYQRIDRKDNSIKSTSVDSEIQLLQLEDKFVLIKRRLASKDTNIAGAVVSVPRDLYLLSDQLKQDPKIQERLLPLLIDSTRFNWGGYFVLIIFSSMLVCGIILIRKAQTRLSDKLQNPSIKLLQRLGDPRALLPAIEDELSRTDSVYRYSNLWLTKNWLINSQIAGIEIRNITELVWVYPQTTSHSINFIPTGKTHVLIVCDNRGKYTQIHLPSADFTAIIETIHSHAPWAFYGFSEEHKRMWNSKMRSAMISQVEDRRQAMAKEAG
ncbi:hypothetical protein BH11CYA1_BH11CYA1_16470 [soil metagenome]